MTADEAAKRISQLEVQLLVRNEALAKIRQLCEVGSEISKIAGHALCIGSNSTVNRETYSAIEEFVRDFETDFMVDDQIVDEPDRRWSQFTRHYLAMKSALETARKAKATS